jgi:hypothetical protein
VLMANVTKANVTGASATRATARRASPNVKPSRKLNVKSNANPSVSRSVNPIGRRISGNRTRRGTTQHNNAPANHNL